MEISKYQLETIIKLALTERHYDVIANKVMDLNLPEEVALIIATEQSSIEEW